MIIINRSGTQEVLNSPLAADAETKSFSESCKLSPYSSLARLPSICTTLLVLITVTKQRRAFVTEQGLRVLMIGVFWDWWWRLCRSPPTGDCDLRTAAADQYAVRSFADVFFFLVWIGFRTVWQQGYKILRVGFF